MDEAQLQLLIALFPGEQDAETAIKALKSTLKEKTSGIQAAVAIRKDQNNEIHYKDVGLTPAKGAMGGVILGATLGILSGGVGIALGAAGALVGGLIGQKKRQGKFASVRMHEIVASLAPGTSAIVAVVERESSAELEKELEASNAEVFTAEVTADLAEKLETHRHTAESNWTEKLDKE